MTTSQPTERVRPHLEAVAGHRTKIDSRRTTHRDGQDGTILIVVMVTAIAMFGLVFTGTLQLKSYQARAEATFRMGGQARNVARSGLIDAFSWFRRQPAQPVLNFAPARDESAVPPVLDTDDPSIGLVREFQISGSIWARYEVRLADPDEPVLSVRDVSALRGHTGQGQAWTLACWGVVFRKQDPAKRYDEAPNQILGTAWAFTETRRITLSPPGEAAICCENANFVRIEHNARVTGGGGAAVAHKPNTGQASISGEVNGNNGQENNEAVNAVVGYNASIETVFGVTFNDLESLADAVVQDPAEFPNPFPANGLVVVKCNMTFDSTTPLRGTGVVIFTGNVLFDSSSQNFFNGVLYIMGDLTFKAPSYLRGTIISEGKVTATGVADVAEIEYDPDLIASLMLNMGQYRISKAIRFGSNDQVQDTQ